jgi:hypothetical protein
MHRNSHHSSQASAFMHKVIYPAKPVSPSFSFVVATVQRMPPVSW